MNFIEKERLIGRLSCISQLNTDDALVGELGESVKRMKLLEVAQIEHVLEKIPRYRFCTLLLHLQLRACIHPQYEVM